MSNKRTSIWQEYPELEEKLAEHIVKDGVLDAGELSSLVNKDAKELGIKANISTPSVRGKLYWLEKRNKEVKEVFKAERLRTIIEERHQLRKDVLRGKWLSIIGIREDINFAHYIPENTSAENPYVVDVADPSNPNVGIINAPLIGSLVEEDEEVDILKNSLKYHQANGRDCLLITGDIIYMLTQKWGTKKPRKSYVIGIDPDPEIMKSAYPDAVLEDKSIEDRIDDGDIIFTTVKARLDMVMQELERIFRDENGNPIFKEDILIVTGETEEDISNHYAVEIVRLMVNQERDKAQRKIEILRHERKHEEDKRSKDKLNQAISEWTAYKKVLVNMSNTFEKYIVEITEHMVGYITNKIEEAIPNAKVVGRGDAFLQIGDKKAFVTRGKATTAYRGNSAGVIREKTYTHIKNNSGLNIPDVILVGGFNPYWTGLYASHFIPELAGSLDDKQMTHIVQLPTALSAGKYREALRNFADIQGSIEKVAEVSDFEAGTTTLKWLSSGLFLAVDGVRSDFLTNREIFSENDKLNCVIDGSNRCSEMIYSEKQGCEHAGARFITQYPSPNDPNGRLVKSHFQVCFEAFVNSDAPIHMFQSDGDTLHWANYSVHKEGFPDNRLNLQEYLDKIIEFGNNRKLTAEKREKMIATLAYEHAISEGVLQPDGQLAFYRHLLRPVKQFLFNIIDRAEQSGLITVGPRLGTITQGQGNHNENSFRRGEINISEAEFVSRGILLELLRVSGPELTDKIENAVVAAVFSDVGEARGMFGIPVDKEKEYTETDLIRMDKDDGYFYALYMMHKQGTSKTKDNMAPMLKAFRNRLTEHQYEANRFSINLGGDDHTGGWALTRTALHVKSGCQMGGNSFGRKSSFPEQNIFSAVWGVPAGGPAWGPMRVIAFDQRFARHYADEPFELPVDELFVNPV